MKRKRIAVSLSIMALTVFIIGVTYALLKDVTETTKNTFSSDKSISISLREPNWDGYSFEKETESIQESEVPLGNIHISDSDYPAGSKAEIDAGIDGASTDTLGFNIASNYLPGDVIPKNPMVKNTSEDESVYVGVKIDYLIKGEGPGSSFLPVSYEDFQTRIGTVVFNNGDGTKKMWEAVSKEGNSDFYFYNRRNSEDGQPSQGEIKVNAATVQPVFSSVIINNDINDVYGKMPEFKIDVKGYAVQFKNVTPDQAKAELIKMAK